jgi:hypothetical protein
MKCLLCDDYVECDRKALKGFEPQLQQRPGFNLPPSIASSPGPNMMQRPQQQQPYTTMRQGPINPPQRSQQQQPYTPMRQGPINPPQRPQQQPPCTPMRQGPINPPQRPQRQPPCTPMRQGPINPRSTARRPTDSRPHNTARYLNSTGKWTIRYSQIYHGLASAAAPGQRWPGPISRPIETLHSGVGRAGNKLHKFSS